ncbi:nucleotidyl transferase AbiEii/AbiGii toxin family protein [Aquihabitans daechungensis]|uniref:nucleotidyl transferase AbiEii/AbiGii toxin family protein n=1 Tax=Aquihabitans daechungensis TaxID=1052257 RepID=UPI003BA1B9DE
MSAAPVLLSGRAGGTTHREVELLAALPPELRLIGGLSVMCRVGSPHRATVDLDAVARDLDGIHPDLVRLAVTAAGGGQYRFAGDLDLDVIDVTPLPTDELLEHLLIGGPDLTDLELNVVAHTWAHDGAEPLDVVAIDEETGARLAHAPGRLIATAAGIVAMKATTVPLRASSKPEKRASDLYDLGRLLVAGQLTSSQMTALPEPLLGPVAARLRHWFLDDAGRDRTYRDVRRFDEPRLDLDDAADAVEDLVGA